jgi:hypothetical protein
LETDIYGSVWAEIYIGNLAERIEESTEKLANREEVSDDGETSSPHSKKAVNPITVPPRNEY